MVAAGLVCAVVGDEAKEGTPCALSFGYRVGPLAYPTDFQSSLVTCPELGTATARAGATAHGVAQQKLLRPPSWAHC